MLGGWYKGPCPPWGTHRGYMETTAGEALKQQFSKCSLFQSTLQVKAIFIILRRFLPFSWVHSPVINTTD